MIDKDGNIVSGRKICSNKSRAEMMREDSERKQRSSISDIASALNRIADNLAALVDAVKGKY